MELVALHPLQAGEEATISYTGPAGMTNQRLMAQVSGWDVIGACVCGCIMAIDSCFASQPRQNAPASAQLCTSSCVALAPPAQYGFVLTGGNPADRLQFAALQAPDSGRGSGEPGSSGGVSSSSNASSIGSSSRDPSSAVLLSLDRMQAALGDGERMAAALSGKDPYSYAALKSLPFAAEEGAAAELGLQLALAERLAAELAAEAAGWPTSMEQDAELVAQQRAAAPVECSSGGSAATDARLAAALAYRLQRKALVTAGQLLLRSFVTGGPKP